MKKKINDIIQIKFLDKDLNEIELAITPSILIRLEREFKKFVKPVDFLTPKEIKEIKQWTIDVTNDLSNIWYRESTLLPNFVKAVGLDFCVLLETLKIADLVLTRIIEKYNCKMIFIVTESLPINNMLQFESHGHQYLELLQNDKWVSSKNIKVQVENSPEQINIPNKQTFSPSIIRVIYFYLRGLFNLNTKFKISILKIVSIKIGFQVPPVPNILLSQNKDNKSLTSLTKSISLSDYLILFKNPPKKTISNLKNNLISNINSIFYKDDKLNNEFLLYREIIIQRIISFINKRNDLMIAYLKLKHYKNTSLLNFILPSAIGCGIDTWASLAIEEEMGFVASTQHGSAYGNSYHPMMIFSDTRFDYFFTYASSSISPTFKFAMENSRAKWENIGSSHLFHIKKMESTKPQSVKKILYVMNLCVPFYSVNFPWEFITYQFQILDLINKFGDRYSIYVKKDFTNTVNEEDYPNLNFINNSPSDVLHDFDLLLIESAVSTIVLEAMMTNKYIAIMTGSDWEDCSPYSLNLLSKRAECFKDYSSYFVGVENILNNPKVNLDENKLKSLEFQNNFCNPVNDETYNNSIIKIINKNNKNLKQKS